MRIGRKAMEFSIEQKTRFIEYINTKWPSPQTCPVCRAEEKWFIPNYIYELREAKHKAKFKFAPLIEIVCANCGYTLLINAIIAGIYENEDMKASNEAGCDPAKDSPVKK